MLSKAGQKVFDARYARRDDNDNIIETFEQAVDRLATVATHVEDDVKQWYDKFHYAISNLLFIPSTPIWANMGKDDRPWQPGACFVLDVEDHLDAMYQTLKDTAMVFRSGGGVGYNFSKIRPKGAMIMSTKGKASGVVELIKLYDASSNMVMQGGVRRGASIGILDISHPEIEAFIDAKLDGSLPNFNLSVGITDEFMHALVNNQSWTLRFNDKQYNTTQAQYLWNKIITAAHACGDPGIVFLDELQKGNPVPRRTIRATNPCGEQPLAPGESCLLGSINLAKMVDNLGRIDFKLLKTAVEIGVRFLDNLIDIAKYPLDYIKESTLATRKIGLGYTGLADLLIKMGVAYDSAKGREVASLVASTVKATADRYTEQLASERSCFPAWHDSVYQPTYRRRNASCVTVAPTGSVTTMAGCEGYGIEPIFAVAYTKSTNVAGSFDVISPLFREVAKHADIPERVLQIVVESGSCQHILGVPRWIQELFKTAQEIHPKDHVAMQATIQQYVDNAVSKTINLPNKATIQDVGTCYMMAFTSKLKGITVFRDGCKKGTITIGKEKSIESLKRGAITPRPESAVGITHRLDTGCGKLYLTINCSDNDNNPNNREVLETFITTGSDGGCQVYTEATSRLISLAIRGGISVEDIVGQLQSTHACSAYMHAKGKGKLLSEGKSCASAIAQKLIEVHRGTSKHIQEATKESCPECGSVEYHLLEGCRTCSACGYSKC